MLFRDAGCAFMGFILYVTGVSGNAKSICALEGSSVDLSCSAKHPTSHNKWYTMNSKSSYGLTEISRDGPRVTYNISAKSQPTITIKELRKSDANTYCCSDTGNINDCKESAIRLQVADIQVKVVPTTDNQTVTLICSTSCHLTETPAAYIWFKNGDFLYEDWSPWYQEVVHGEVQVRYSCAIKGYKNLSAPEVSVDSVTPTCINVTYAKGRMCQKTTLNESCSITYPSAVRVERLSVSHMPICTTSCPLTEPKTTHKWYCHRQKFQYNEKQFNTTSCGLSCAFKGFEDLLSPEVCADDKCWSVNYANRRICVAQGSSVNISSEYSHPYDQPPQFKLWYKRKRNGEGVGEEKTLKTGSRVRFHDSGKNLHTLSITNLNRNNSAEYIFRLKPKAPQEHPDFPGVTLVVTGLRVKLRPAVGIEGQRVTLTCMTSCPLSNTIYLWYLNSQLLPQHLNKHLFLDPVRSQHAGNYSCATETSKRTSEKTLKVQSVRVANNSTVVAARGCAVLLVVIPLVVFFWIRRKKRTSGQSHITEATKNPEQLIHGPVYENISTQPTEQDDHH